MHLLEHVHRLMIIQTASNVKTHERRRNMNDGIRKISLHAMKRNMLTWFDSILTNKRLTSCALSGPICYNSHEDH